MSNIFEKNLNALKAKNAELADKIQKYFPDSMPELVRENGFYNLKYKNKYLHNPENPLMQAKEIFSMAENSPVAIHLVFGLGLGYLFQVTSANSAGTVILYEPDLNILKIAFTLVDFSNDISKQNVYIADTLETAEKYIYEKSNIKNTPLLLTTQEYRNIDEVAFNDMLNELQRIVGMFGLDRQFTQEKFFPATCRIIENIPTLLNEVPLVELKGYYKDKTAVVISAGPTLDRNLEALKEYRNKIVIIAVGTAMKTLAKHNIVPDFLSIIEFNDCTKQIEGLDLSDVNFISEPFTHSNVKNFKFKNSYLHISSNMPVNYLWSNIAGIDNSEYVSKGTVAYTALNTARILGCSKIVLVGQDLAYIEGQCYSKDSAYKDLVCVYDEQERKWKITAKDFDSYSKSLCNTDDRNLRDDIARNRLTALNSSLYYVKGINGDMIPTESVYAAFIQPLSEFTKKFQGIEYINTSLVGAQIDGFKNLPIEEALKDSPEIESRSLNTDYKYNKFLIKQNLFAVNESLKQILCLEEELLKMCNHIKNDLLRYRNVTVEILKSLKKLFSGYSILSTEYSDKNKVFDFITASDRIDVEYQIKITKEFTVDNVTSIINKLETYGKNSISNITTVTGLLDKVIGDLNEDINTKS